MTKQKKYPRTELSDAVAPTRERYRELIDAACAWQAGRERQNDPDHFALICAAAEDAWDDDVTPTRWSRTTTYHVARCDITNWSSVQGCSWPETILETMWDWFDFLLDTGRLHPQSDPVAELRKPLACYGWLDQHGRRLPPAAPRQIECECFLPYRETVELLSELVRQSEYRCGDPLDALRAAVGRPVSRPRWDPDDVLFGDDGDQLDGYGSVGLLDDLPGNMGADPRRPDSWPRN